MALPGPVTDPRVTAIRSDPEVGEGSCSVIDECYTDEELSAYLDSRGVGPKAVKAAVKEARATNEIWWEVQREREAATRW